MDRQQRQLMDGLRQAFAGTDEVFSGVVKSVDESNATIDVMPDDNNEEFVLPVMLRSVISGLKGIVLIPKVGSEVTFCSIEGAGKFTIINAAELDKVLIDVPQMLVTCDNVVINKGNNDGLAVVGKVADEFQEIQKDVNTLKTLLNKVLTTPVNEPGNGSPSAFQIALKTALTNWVGSSLKLTNKGNIENNKVKH